MFHILGEVDAELEVSVLGPLDFTTKICNYPRFNSQHNWRDLYDHL